MYIQFIYFSLKNVSIFQRFLYFFFILLNFFLPFSYFLRIYGINANDAVEKEARDPLRSLAL